MAKSGEGRGIAAKQQRRSGHAKSKKAAGFSATRSTAWKSAKMRAARAVRIYKRKVMLDKMTNARASRSPTAPTGGSPHAKARAGAAKAGSQGHTVKLNEDEARKLSVLLAATTAMTLLHMQGHVIDKVTAEWALRIVDDLNRQPVWVGSLTALFDTAARLTGLSRTSVAKIWSTAIERGELYYTDTTGRGCADINHPLSNAVRWGQFGQTPSQGAATIMAVLEPFIDTRLKDSLVTATTDMYDELRAKVPQAAWLILVTDHYLRALLHEYGYVWGRVRSCIVGRMSEERRANDSRRFLLMYDQALKEQKQDEAIIVYMDESYIYLNHHACTGWSKQGDGEVPSQSANWSKSGTRLLIIHACTRDGMLIQDPSEENDVKAFTGVRLNAEGIFKDTTGADKSDYHKSFNGTIFMNWARHRMLPTVQALYPDKKVYYVLDNAAYHHTRSKNAFNPHAADATKTDILDFLLHNNVPSLTFTKKDAAGVDRHVQFALTPSNVAKLRKGTASKHNDIPSKEQLADIAQLLIAANEKDAGGLFAKTEFQQLLAEASAKPGSKGHVAIYTMPYGSIANPIEMVWGVTKNAVAKAYPGHKAGTSEAVMRARVRKAMYVTCRLARGAEPSPRTGLHAMDGIIRHAHKDINTIYVRHHKTVSKYGSCVGEFRFPAAEEAAVKAEVAALMEGYIPAPDLMGAVELVPDDHGEAVPNPDADALACALDMVALGLDGGAGAGAGAPAGGGSGGAAGAAGASVGVQQHDDSDEVMHLGC
jgi:transposase